MPNRTKKNPKNNSQAGGSHWHNFHFSGKLIVCSVIFGLMLILIGGIVMAIGMDRDEDTKSDDYEDLQKKPPMAIVGPVIMGIGGFTVVVGVFMCLVETNVCRRRNIENRSLIEHEDRARDSAATGIDSEPSAIPSSPHRHRNGNARKHPQSPRKSRHGKKPYSTKDRNHGDISPRSPASVPISVLGSSSKQFLSASDKFLTPPSSFATEMPPNSKDADVQTSSSLMKSFTSSGYSWNASTDFQTPNASSVENSMSLDASPNERLNTLNTNLLINSHEFLTPKATSGIDMLVASKQNPNNQPISISTTEISNEVSRENTSVLSHETEADIENKQIKSKAPVEANINQESEDTNLDTEYHSSDTLPIGEIRGGNKSQIKISDTKAYSDEILENKKNDMDIILNMPLDLSKESNQIDKSPNAVLNQENHVTASTCVNEDNIKSFDKRENVSEEPENIIPETGEEASRNQSDNTKANNETVDISNQDNAINENEQIMMGPESANDEAISTSNSAH